MSAMMEQIKTKKIVCNGIPMVTIDFERPKAKIKFKLSNFDDSSLYFLEDNGLHFEEGESYNQRMINYKAGCMKIPENGMLSIYDIKKMEQDSLEIYRDAHITEIYVNVDEVDKFHSLFNVIKEEKSKGKCYSSLRNKWIDRGE